MELEEVESLYIIQLRESIRLCEDVYKVGKTKVMCKREKQYPKGSKVIIVIEVDDCNIAEKNMIKYFKEKFKQRRDFGTEYFEGNINEMIDYYKSICKKDITNIYSNSKVQKKEIVKITKNELKSENMSENMSEKRVNDYSILEILEDHTDYNDVLNTSIYKKILLIKEMMMKIGIKLEDINANMILRYSDKINCEDYVEIQERICPLFRLGNIKTNKYKDYYFLLIKMIRNVSNLIDDIKRKYINKGNTRVCYYDLKPEFQEYLKILKTKKESNTIDDF